MYRWILAWWIVLLLSGRIGAQEKEEPLILRATSAEGHFEYDEEHGIARDPAGLILTYRDVELTAKEIRFFRGSGVIEARGDVRLRRGEDVWVSDALRYNFQTGTVEAEKFRFGHPPLFIAGERLHGDSKTHIQTATNVFLTTDDVAQPAHRVRAHVLRLLPGQYVEVEDATFYLGKVPVMYLPKYRYTFGKRGLRISPQPGYRSIYGPYLLTTIGWSPAKNLDTQAHLDYRAKRGVGVGLDLFPDLGLEGSGRFSVYFAPDARPGRTPSGKSIDSNRYRVRLEYKAHPSTNFSFRAALRKQSDLYMIRDFFDGEYRADREPKTFAEVSWLASDWTLDVMAMPRLNEFFQTVERIPDIRLTAYEQPVFHTPLYYQSQSSVAYLRFCEANKKDPSFEALRADTYQQLSIPTRLFEAVTVTPRAGVRLTHYKYQKGLDNLPHNPTRWVFHTAVDASTKFWRLWPEAHSSLLELDGVRHIVEPTLTYAYIPRPSPVARLLPQFDYQVPAFRPLPITLPEYNAVDAIGAENVFRFGLRNRFQTKREGRVEDWLDWWAFFDWYPDPHPHGGGWGKLYSALDFKPRNWITLTSEVNYDIQEGNLLLADHRIVFTPNDRWSWSLGHRYLHNWLGLSGEWDNNLFESSFYYKLNEDWAFRFLHRFEARDGRLEEQQYTIYRDLRTWTGAISFRIREPKDGPTDYTIGVSFSIKAFPRYRVGEDQNRPELLLGG